MDSAPLPFPEIHPSFTELDRGERTHVVVAEVHGSAAALLLGALVERLGAARIAVTARESDARNLELDLRMLRPEARVVHLPERLSAEPGSPEGRRNRSEREAALRAIREQPEPSWIVASLKALSERTGVPTAGTSECWSIRVGERIDRDELRHALFSSGLEPSPLVESPGEMSLRGDVLDFFLYGSPSPIRIELFDQEIESIRTFDPESQRSKIVLQVIEIERQLRTENAAETANLRQSSERFCALDAFCVPPVVFRIDPVAIEQVATDVADAAALHARLTALRHADLHPEFHAGAELNFGARPAEGSLGIEDIGRWAQTLPSEVRAIHLFSSTSSEGKRLSKLLRARLPPSPRRAVHDHRGSLTAGFVLPSLGLWVGNHHELLSRTRLRRPEAEASLPTRSVREALELSPGDYVVHHTHGVGLYRGIKEHEQQGGTEDYLLVEYEDATLLYVPASKMELLTRYIGPGGNPPKLDRLGGRSFARKKAGVESALDEMAQDLIELHAARKTKPGHRFAPDDDMQAEFDSSFPFADTGDQVSATEEIKRDMESARAMDRLLCGDVGFGKTEVAIRAAFKAAVQGKQVAILAPTTLLVRQHLETLRNRMANYPVRIEALSRLTHTKKVPSILEGITSGHVDIVVGSHRLLTPSVKFKDLGLLIIDEEQRFGVRHKETLKKLRADVDVLTLSATPIPRTLHMALVGLRDVSVLREAPKGRRPVKTVVTYPDDALVKSAIERELEREGQVFYLFNRVQGIERVAQKLHEMIPRARIAVAHGQLSPTELEEVAERFAGGEIDLLVCTTIIESGIDIPRVNTLIVEGAERMGLADLHQLRGRIGRSERQAYSVFLIPKKPLPAIALKRIRALEGLSHLGAGFDIAIRDLEIRGAGNLLGREQSGHIASIGYDLYCRLLARAIAKKRGKRPPPEPEEIDIGIGVPAFLPREYVRFTHQRMGLLRRLGEARKEDEISAVEEELRDRFGRLPEPAQNLLDLMRTRELCRRFGISRIFYPGGSELLLNVKDLARFNRVKFGEAEARWVEGSRVHLILPPRINTPEALLRYLLSTWGGAESAPPPTTELEKPHEDRPAAGFDRAAGRNARGKAGSSQPERR